MVTQVRLELTTVDLEGLCTNPTVLLRHISFLHLLYKIKICLI